MEKSVDFSTKSTQSARNSNVFAGYRFCGLDFVDFQSTKIGDLLSFLDVFAWSAVHNVSLYAIILANFTDSVHFDSSKTLFEWWKIAIVGIVGANTNQLAGILGISVYDKNIHTTVRRQHKEQSGRTGVNSKAVCGRNLRPN